MIRELDDHLEYYVKFNPPKDSRLSDWYLYPELEFVTQLSPYFRPPKANEIRNIESIEMGQF